MYHLFTSLPFHTAADYIVAGDGVYKVLDCFGIRVPLPLVSCEIRGLPSLSPQLIGHAAADMSETACLFDFGPSYHILTEDHPTMPSVDPRRVYQYVIAREGVFLQASCPGLEVLMPISHGSTLPGLASVAPVIRFSYPLVGEELVLAILERAQTALDSAGHPIERLFYLTWDGLWRLHEPEQDAGPTHVRARHVAPEHQTAVLEGHSHHGMPAYFSRTDNQAELYDGGFRVYFVLGRIFTQPELRVRICVHGYAWEVPASTFFVVPSAITDCVAKEWESLA